MPPKILSEKEILKNFDLIPISWGKMKIKSLESNVNTNCWKKKVHIFGVRILEIGRAHV